MRSPAPPSSRRRGLVGLTTAALVAAPLALGLAAPATADVSTPISSFPYTQTWPATAITLNDNWSGVSGVQGYRGEGIVSSAGIDPQTITGESAVANDTDVNANQTNPSTYTTGGVTEFDTIPDPSVALAGSGTARAPSIVFHLDLTGRVNPTFAFDARDLDASTDNAVQQIALQYRVGATGPYKNLTAGYIADATTVDTATQVTSRSVELPDEVDGQASVFVRVLTADAVGSDEYVGIDNVAITATAGSAALSVTNPGPQTSTVGTAIEPLVLAAGGGTAPYTFEATNLPDGLTLAGNQITGTPTTPGTPTVEVTVTDGAGGTASTSFVWTVNAAPVLQPIAQIQGSGSSTSQLGQTVLTRGVVTAAYPSGGFFGFYMQTEGTGGASSTASRTTSDGIFVRQAFGSGPVTVQPGDFVQVTGKADEFAQQTQILVSDADDITEPAVAFQPVTPTVASAWPATATQKEALEGMLVAPQGLFTVTDNYFTNIQGELTLARGDSPLIQPTQVGRPGSAEALATAADNAARVIVLDDGSSTAFNLSANSALTPPYISNTAPNRVGASGTFDDAVILTQGGDPAEPTYRFQPTATVVGPANANAPIAFENTRTAAPDESFIAAKGTPAVKVASFNVLNYFTTLGDANDDNVGDGGCNPFRDRTGDGNNVNNGCEQRGAWDPQDFDRQQTKIVAAINALDADVVGLMEIENSAKLGETPDEATQSLVAALNAASAPGTWAANPSSSDLPPAADQDVITNAIIYKPAAVSRVGASRALGDQSTGNNTASDEAFANAREPLAQAFVPVAGGDPFMVVVNHFKSKGSAGPFAGDADAGDGQGSSNQSRVRQAQALAAWVPTVQGNVDDVLLLGDFNSYAQEDPLHVLYGQGYVNFEVASGNDEYSYSFDSMSGSLDHVIGNASAFKRFTGADVWNINGVEPLVMEYSRYNYHGTDFHTDGPWRSSDHDPVIVGLTATDPVVTPPAGPVDTTVTGTAAPIVYGQAGTVAVKVAPASAAGTATLSLAGVFVGSTTLASGAGTIAVPAMSLPAGTYQLGLAYSGDAGHKSSTTSVTLVVAKATPEITAKAKPRTVKAKKTRAKIVVRVEADGYTPTGKVRVRVAGKVYRARLVDGKAVVKLKKFATPRTYKAKVRYRGDANTEAARTTVKIKVKRR